MIEVRNTITCDRCGETDEYVGPNLSSRATRDGWRTVVVWPLASAMDEVRLNAENAFVSLDLCRICVLVLEDPESAAVALAEQAAAVIDEKLSDTELREEVAGIAETDTPAVSPKTLEDG